MTVRRRLFAACFLIAILGIAGAEERTVRIETARSTEYSGKTDETGIETVRFTGGVSLVVTEGTTVSRISADEIVYDKTNETLMARGNVTYERKTGQKGGQTFTGEALFFSIRDQEGEFLAGSVTQDSGKKNGDPYIVHAEISGRDSGTTMAFKSGVLTTCDDPDPHWSIKASRIWLLPGNEIALLNGIFFIGPLPLLYIPAFYYPSDEMIVHPVFGVRNRQGAFVQTTTYLAGRKPIEPDTGNGAKTFSNFLQSDTLKEQERNGLFLKNLETDAKDTSPDYVKLMVDAYSSLGGMAGLEGQFTPKSSYIRSLSFSSLFGVSRTLYPPVSGIAYLTYDPTGEQNLDSGWIAGEKIPFRYRFDFSLSMDKAPFNVTVKLPFISDPYFKQDFMDRSENLNWFNYILNQEDLAKGASTATETSFAWNLYATVTPQVARLNPWITTLSISDLSGTMTFSSKKNASLTGYSSTYTSERSFFYPEVLKPAITLSLGGTLLSGGDNRSAAPSATARVDTGSLPDPFAEKTDPDAEEVPSDSEDTESISMYIPLVPVSGSLNVQSFDPKWSLVWTYKPSLLEEIRYDSASWNEPSDVDWNEFSSVFWQLKNSASLNGKYSAGSLYSLSSALNFTSTNQERPWVSDSLDTNTKNANKLADYKASTWLLSSSDNATFSPFPKPSAFYPTSVSWDLTGKVYQSEFSGTLDNPTWKIKPFRWEKDYVTAHKTTVTAGVSIAENVQTLTLVSSLDPLLQSYEGDATLSWAPFSVVAGSKLFEKEKQAKRWYWDPFTSVVTVSLPYSTTFKQSYTYDIEEGESKSLVYTLSVPYVTATYEMNYTLPYRLDPLKGWNAYGTDKKFMPTLASLRYTNVANPLRVSSWKNRIALQAAISSNLNMDLLRTTNSSLDFVPQITLKVHDFLDLSFSTTSRNDVIARYFQDYVELPTVLPGETNPFLDLARSFWFWDTKARTDSGFKLKSLTLKATHYVHDWTATLDTSVQPDLVQDGAKFYYDFKPTISFMVQWKPISDIKTSVKSEKGAFTLNTASSDSVKTK